MKGTWQTTGGGGDAVAAAAGIGAVVVIGALAFEAAKGAARSLGEVAVIAVVAAVALAIGAGVTLLAVRLRRRRRAAPAATVQLWHANPQAIPAPERRAIAPPQPQVVNHFHLDPASMALMLRGQAITPPQEQEQPWKS